MTEPEQHGYAAAIVVAAGKGERFGHRGKVLASCGGRPLIAWSLDALEASASVRDIVIVFGDHTERGIRELVERGPWSKIAAMVAGGSNRQESVACGIAVMAKDVEIVLVHDAARPMVEAAQCDACATSARVYGAAILAASVVDTLKRVENGVILETVSRTGLWAAQTPQAFRRADYREALAGIAGREHEFTDDASIFEASGRPVAIVAGTRLNIKVTHPEDLVLVELLLRERTTLARAQELAGQG